jgi:hypothetical protein
MAVDPRTNEPVANGMIDPVPSGSVPVGDNTVPLEEPVVNAAPPEDSDGDPNIPEKFKGKDAKDIAASYVQLEEKLGEMSQEVGDSRKAQGQMLDQMQQLQQQLQSQTPQSEQPDLDAQLADIAQQAENGDISFGEGMRQSAAIAAKQGAKIASQQFQAYENDRSNKADYDNFVKENPEYPELVASGELQKVKGPEDDNLSAFWKWKANDSASKAKAAAEEAYEKGKREVQELKDGVDVTTKVIAKPGNEIRQTNKPKTQMSRGQMEDSLLDALNKSRAG